MSVGWWIALGIGAAIVAAVALRGRETTAPATAGGVSPPASESRFEERLPGIPLETRETAFFGRWWQGERGGDRVAFQPMGKGVTIFAGDFDPDAEQLSSIYLSQVNDATPLPADGSPQRLATALGNVGADLDPRFFLNATGGDYAEIRSAEVRGALLGLSDSVLEVMIFETGGVELIADEHATPESISADLDRALAIHRHLRTRP